MSFTANELSLALIGFFSIVGGVAVTLKKAGFSFSKNGNGGKAENRKITFKELNDFWVERKLALINEIDLRNDAVSLKMEHIKETMTKELGHGSEKFAEIKTELKDLNKKVDRLINRECKE